MKRLVQVLSREVLLQKTRGQSQDRWSSRTYQVRNETEGDLTTVQNSLSKRCPSFTRAGNRTSPVDLSIIRTSTIDCLFIDGQHPGY